MNYKAIPCPCGYQVCKFWMVSGVAAVQGVSFTKSQAELVAYVLNKAGTLVEEINAYPAKAHVSRLRHMLKALETEDKS